MKALNKIVFFLLKSKDNTNTVKTIYNQVVECINSESLNYCLKIDSRSINFDRWHGILTINFNEFSVKEIASIKKSFEYFYDHIEIRDLEKHFNILKY